MPRLYVILAGEYSGAETLQVPVLRADEDPLVACPPGSRTEAWARSLGVPTIALPERTMRVSGGAAEAARGLLRLGPAVRDVRRILRARPERDVIVGTSARPSLVAALAATGLPGRRVVWMVTDLLPGPPIGTAMRAVARLSRAQPLALSAWLVANTGLREAVVSHPGVPLPPLTDEPRDPHRALLVGHVSHVKKTDLAVEIAVRAAASAPALQLDIVGRAQYRPEDLALEETIRRRLEADAVAGRHVTLVGHDPDVVGRMRRAGLLLHCRDDEPFGMVLVEAMAAGLPVVAPAAAGPLEIVLDGETGFLYPPGDIGAAAAAVARLVNDPPLARRMGEAGRERVRTAFSPERQVADFLAIASFPV